MIVGQSVDITAIHFTSTNLTHADVAQKKKNHNYSLSQTVVFCTDGTKHYIWRHNTQNIIPTKHSDVLVTRQNVMDFGRH